MKVRCILPVSFCCVLFIQSVSALALQAATPWVVRQVEVQGGAALCSMKNSWPDGVELVFARNRDEANSIAVDFRRNMLQPGREYPVALQMEGLVRTVTGIAATTQVLMIRMGYDHAFYDALQRKESLALSFGEQQMSFGLQGTAEAMKKLESCVSVLSAQADTDRSDRHLKSVFDILKEGAVETPARVAPVQTPVPPAPKAVVKVSKSPERSGKEKMGGSLVQQAVSESLGAEIERLRAENRALLQENMAIRTAAETQKAAAAEPAAGHADNGDNGDDAEGRFLSKVLLATQIPSLDGFESIQDDGTFAKRFHWRDGAVTGTASDVIWPDGRGREQAVDTYMQSWKSTCSGDFAQTFGPPRAVGAVRVMEAESVCVDGVRDSAAAFLFVEGEKGWVVLAQETVAETLPEALAKRDGYIASLATVRPE